MKSPYPEEFNRQSIGLTASLHFAPTQKAADALLKEGKDPEQIFVIGWGVFCGKIAILMVKYIKKY